MTMLPTSTLSDAQLVDATKRLLASERATVAQVVVHLAEIELRRIHLEAGFPSLYAYCLEELHLSEYEALNRIEAARAGRTYPRVLAMLAEGTLTLTTVQLLARKLTPDNHEVLLSEGGRANQERGTGAARAALSATGRARDGAQAAEWDGSRGARSWQ